MTGHQPINKPLQQGLNLQVSLATACMLSLALCLTGCHKKPAPPPPAPESVAVVKPSEPLPARLSGLWQTQLTEEGSAEAPQILQICIDALTDKHLGILGTDLSGDTCTKTTYNSQADGTWNVLAECIMGTGVVTEYSGSITGDVTKDFTLTVRSQTTGGNLDRVTSYTVVSKRISACKAGQKAGDVISDGIKMNLFDMSGVKHSGSRSSSSGPDIDPDVVD